MSKRLGSAALVPRGFVLDRLDITDSGTEVVIRGIGRTSVCPDCGNHSARVHSRYRRCLGDLPLAGRPVRLILKARRFRCFEPTCRRTIFAERFANGQMSPWARRTARLELLVLHLGLALGGRPAARFARRLMTPVSNDTLLRAVRKSGRSNFAAPHVIGIDDWAWGRNH